ncbi:MAG: hypothetical protein H6816_12980 [Phycisphaerales bacterium]|nr:hypothetical protein [Phycisphaerales bacterium]
MKRCSGICVWPLFVIVAGFIGAATTRAVADEFDRSENETIAERWNDNYDEYQWYNPADWFGNWGYENQDDWDYDDGAYGYHDYDYPDYGYDYYTYDYGRDNDFDDYLNDEGDYAYGWYWNPDADDWQYGHHYEPYAYGYDWYDYDPFTNESYRSSTNRTYDFDRQFNGRVVGLRRIKTRDGKVDSVQLRVRTDDGRTRTVQLGDYGYVRENLPSLRPGEHIRIAGRNLERDGRNYFQAEQIRSASGSFDIPNYRYDRVMSGRLAGVKAVRTRDGEVEGMVAQVKGDNGKTFNVVIGSPASVHGNRRITTGDRIHVNGFSRTLNGNTTFFANSVDVRSRSNASNRQGERQQASTRRSRAR